MGEGSDQRPPPDNGDRLGVDHRSARGRWPPPGLGFWRKLGFWLTDASFEGITDGCWSPRPDGCWSPRPQDRLPPQLPRWKMGLLWIARSILFLSLIFVAWQFPACLFASEAPSYSYCPSDENTGIFYTYLAFSLILSSVIVGRLLRYGIDVHESRLEVPSEIDSLIVEARFVEPRVLKPIKPDNFEEKKKQILREVQRLVNISPAGWTVFEVLHLNQMIVDFLKIEDLMARARTSLTELQDYADGSDYPYDKEQYIRWESRIDRPINTIECIECTDENAMIRDCAAEPLRAELRSLLGYVADMDNKWSEGSAIINSLIFICFVAVVLFFTSGLLPLIIGAPLNILNWSLLSTGASLSSVLWYLYKTEEVEVGNTDGKSQVRRAVISVPLGVFAGIVTHSFVSSGLVDGPSIPNPTTTEAADVGLSILFAISAGLVFERVVERTRSSFQGT